MPEPLCGSDYFTGNAAGHCGLMLGNAGSGDVERWVAAARRAAAADLVASLERLPGIERLIVALPQTEHAQLDFAKHPAIHWEFDLPQAPFHFGQRLAEIVRRHALSRVFYLSAGSMPLMSEGGLAQAVSQIANSHARQVVTNNVHSADWAILTEAEHLSTLVHWLDRDNPLVWRLRESAGYSVTSLPPSGATRLDIDTPFDLQVLALHPQTSTNLRAVLQSLTPDLNLKPIQQAIEVLRQPGSRVTLIGRVSPAAWQALEQARLWTRVFSEERGMVANQRQAAGQVFSLIADYVDQVGEDRFVAYLAQTSDLVLFDTRVYLAHHRCWPAAEERFASDLGRSDKINDARLRRLTQAVTAAPIPILCGGHNVVSGGLYALLEIAEQP